MAQDWDIKPRGDACAACRKPFEDRQLYHTSLVFDDKGYIRVDQCEKCWLQGCKEVSAYSTWQGVYRPCPPETTEVLKKETAESLLRRLMEEGDASNRNVIYILAVMLERQRILVERDEPSTEDGDIVRVYEHRKTGETFLIPDPGLRLDQLEEVQRQVAEMLGPWNGQGQESAEKSSGDDSSDSGR